MAAALSLVAVAAPTALAQAPPIPAAPEAHPPNQGAYKDIALDVETTYVRVPYLGRVGVEASIREISRDGYQQPGVPAGQPGGPLYSTVRVDLEIVGGPKSGWSVGNGLAVSAMSAGDVATGIISFSVAGAVKEPFITVNLTVTMETQDGTVLTDSEQILAQVIPYYRGTMKVADGGYPPGIVGQYEKLTVPVDVTNDGLYIDAFLLNVTAPPGFLVALPPQITVPPGETRTVNLSIVTPKGKLFEFGNPVTLLVNMQSLHDPRVTFTVPIGLFIRGSYVGTEYEVLTPLALLCIGLLVHRRRQHSELRTLEKGLPRRPELTPRQRVLLAELKRRDPEAYRARRAQLAAVYAARRKSYREHRRSEVQAERAELAAARVELKEERERRKLEAKENKKAEKARRKQEAVLRKERRKRMKVLEKERAKLEKQRAKVQAKEDKARAKEAAKLSKVMAKKQKALEKERAKVAKAEAKAAKAAAKSAKKGGKSG